MCWFHMRKCAENKLSIIADKTIRTQLLQDIDALQLAPSEHLFDAAAKLFINKWMGVKCSNITTYLQYFESEWIHAHKG